MGVVVGGSCTIYNRVMARKNLVDGARAYNERQFPKAEELFRAAVEYDQEGATFEGRTSRLFLARTLHSGYAGNRQDTAKAEAAIQEYQKALDGFVLDLKAKREAVAANPQDEELRKELESAENNVGSIVRSVASLYQNLGQEDKWAEWTKQAADNADLPGDVRANSLVGLAAKEYNCANDVTDSKDVKTEVEGAFEFKKPENNENWDKEFGDAKQCVETGMGYIDKAIELDPESDSAWSYRTSLLVQKSRIAEIEGDNAKKEEFKKASDEAKKKFEELAEKRRKAEAAEEAARQAEAAGGESGESEEEN
ncbi:MAG: hypothetical protein DWQ47_05915 [Acidobacteria bacterium]|nr:MAG: hypothetical protein DWQ32_09465 [Acidobacteriota bacterium]REK01916.1 MAG: hypothetical protein DWQ38_05900 [Acidobacteriota bacterium]REK14872.1 MAG: hypothetical protein DWQ43_15155 [Acidobacteriota bacterium]REK45587.1 MAG: hypothetical protein DWQ47_05915 [Acidobacteriota bacterium]